MFQEAVLEERDSQTPYIHLSNSLSSLSGMSDHDLTCHLPHRQRLVSPFLSPSDSMEFLKDLDMQPFREYVFAGLPMLVHPLIILRLLAHKLFGNMIRRKTLTSDAKLKPPKVDDKMPECPPRRELGPGPPRDDSKDSLSRKRKPTLPCPVPASSVAIERDDTFSEFSEINDTSSNASNKTGSCHNHVQSKNGSTKLALKTMVESLVTPLDLTVISHNAESAGSPTTQVPSDAPDSANEVKSSSSRTFFRWPSKKRLSKSHANVAVLSHQDSLASQDPSTSSSAGDVDIAAFQRELINLPTFVMDTPPVDVSPVFSRCSSVPENLAGRSKSGALRGSGKLGVLGVDTDSEHTLATAEFVLNGSSRGNGGAGGDGWKSVGGRGTGTGSLVTITTTNMDYSSDEPQPVVSGSSDVESPGGEAGAAELTNIVVHFEAPSSPQPSTSSQSPDATMFQFPPLPHLPGATSPTTTTAAATIGTTCNSNFLSPHQEYGVSSFGLPGPCVSTSSTHTTLHSPLTTVSERTSTHTLKGSVVAAACEIPVQHRGVLKVLETWVQKSHIDLDGNSVLALETRDFLRKLSVLGHEYKAWCQKMSAMLHVEVRPGRRLGWAVWLRCGGMCCVGCLVEVRGWGCGGSWAV